MAEQISVDADRLIADLTALASIGRNDEGGIDRRAFSAADMAGRQWLREQLESLSIESRLDGAANVIAVLPGRDRALARVVTGSHLDTVPGAGQLDGALGVVAGLEVLRTLAIHQIELSRDVELVAFSDEEGRFGGMLGSAAMSGQLTPEFLEQAEDLDGIRLRDAMAECGMRAADALTAEREPTSIHAFVELHIEQGPVLDRSGEPIGLGDAITGLFRWDGRFVGEANHAGTTPMSMRRDAFRAIGELSGQIDRILEEHGSLRSRATIGRVELEPGVANVVPGVARFSLEVRDTDTPVLAALSDAFRRTCSAIARRHELSFEFEVTSELAPTSCHERVMAAIGKACAGLGVAPTTMPSGAAHDAQMMANVAPAGMIFVPSRMGRSHSPAEWTAPADLVRGTDVLLHTIMELAR